MPTLPEIVVYTENLNRRLKGSKVKLFEVYKPDNFNIPVQELNNLILGKSLQAINRIGKDIEFLFPNNARLQINLMTKGGFQIKKKFEKIDNMLFSLLFDNGDTLILRDSSGFSTVTLNPILSEVPDPFAVSIEYLRETIAQNPMNSIKNTLLDKNVILGLDNDFTDDILWHSRISPKSVSSRIPEEVLNDLVLKIKSVLEDAIRQIRIINPEIISGEERSFLSVHTFHRALSPTGHKIIREKIRFRETFYTDEQILYV